MIQVFIDSNLIEKFLATGAVIRKSTIVEGIPEGAKLIASWFHVHPPRVELLFDDGDNFNRRQIDIQVRTEE